MPQPVATSAAGVGAAARLGGCKFPQRSRLLCGGLKPLLVLLGLVGTLSFYSLPIQYDAASYPYPGLADHPLSGKRKLAVASTLPQRHESQVGLPVIVASIGSSIFSLSIPQAVRTFHRGTPCESPLLGQCPSPRLLGAGVDRMPAWNRRREATESDTLSTDAMRARCERSCCGSTRTRWDPGGLSHAGAPMG